MMPEELYKETLNNGLRLDGLNIGPLVTNISQKKMNIYIIKTPITHEVFNYTLLLEVVFDSPDTETDYN